MSAFSVTYILFSIAILFTIINGQCSQWSDCKDCVEDENNSCEWDKSDEYCYNWFDNTGNDDGAFSSFECPADSWTNTIITVACVIGGICCLCIIGCILLSRFRKQRISQISSVNHNPQPVPQPVPQTVQQPVVYAQPQQVQYVVQPQQQQQQIMYVDQHGNPIQPQAIQQQPQQAQSIGYNEGGGGDAPPAYPNIASAPAYTSQ
mmetsp:Transcript_61035/g.55035  ORF Transcript_61035/g.55035 Transcript_61035/m.55035 type:complete len:205 (+) Transcript_61035:34-648(+)